jgi:hypothetical protein
VGQVGGGGREGWGRASIIYRVHMTGMSDAVNLITQVMITWPFNNLRLGEIIFQLIIKRSEVLTASVNYGRVMKWICYL